MERNKSPKKQTHYETLGIVMTASDEEIKSSFRSLALKYHPDKCSDKDAEEKMKNINEAYKILKNENLRFKYNLLLETGTGGEVSEDSFEYEEEIYEELPSDYLNRRWSYLVIGMKKFNLIL
jgi:curved DNA-binding protein CbpA